MVMIHNRILAEKHTALARAHMQLAMNHQRLAHVLSDMQTDPKDSAIVQLVIQEQNGLAKACVRAKLELHNHVWSGSRVAQTADVRYVPIKRCVIS